MLNRLSTFSRKNWSLSIHNYECKIGDQEVTKYTVLSLLPAWLYACIYQLLINFLFNKS